MNSSINNSGVGEDHLNSALSQLRLKLLDLTGRNRLINFKPSLGKSLQFVEGQDVAIFERLVEATAKSQISITGLPEPSRIEWEDRNGRIQRPDPRDWAKMQGISTTYEIHPLEMPEANLRALLYADDLAKHCRKIEREANLAIEETGSNMLFLVLGFLEFPDQRVSDKSFSAPLISIPVSLQKKEVAGIQQFSVQYTGDDISENLSLREKLKNDYGITLPELSEEEINLASYFSEIQAVIDELPGFSLRRRVTLCLLSFSNMLLVRDLDPTKWPEVNQLNGLIDHPIIRAVFEGSESPGGSGLILAEEHPVEDGLGATIPLVYDADSSQHSALVDVLALKKNLVIQGPPGTGKSQTITNLIAASIAQGKKVLFVAEKLAALEVVKNRLALAGLDPFVLELHSNKANKKKVLEEISARIEHQPTISNDLPRLQQQLEAHRNELKTYSDLVNSVVHNSFGLTLHQIIWRAEKHRSVLTAAESQLSQISISDSSLISEIELDRRLDCLSYLSAKYNELGGFDSESVFWGFFPEQLVPGDDVILKNLFEESMSWAKALYITAIELETILEDRIPFPTLEGCIGQINALDSLFKNAPSTLPLHLIPIFFKNDSTGKYSKEILRQLSLYISEYQIAVSKKNEALSNSVNISPELLTQLHNLSAVADQFGVMLGTCEEISKTKIELNKSVQVFIEKERSILNFAHSKNISYNGTTHKLKQLDDFSILFLNAPTEHLSLQVQELAQDGAVKSIQSLIEIQNNMVQVEASLSQLLYLDAIPSESEIKEAVATFRDGDTWYRFMQSDWRKAKKLHMRLQREKTKLSVFQRLEHLEKLLLLLSIREKWKTQSTWVKYLGISSPTSPIALEGYLALAEWNSKVKAAADDLNIKSLSIGSFTAETVRSLKREWTDVSADLAAIKVSLKSIDKLAPRLGDHEAPSVTKNIVERVSSVVSAMDSCLQWLDVNANRSSLLYEVERSVIAALRSYELKILIDESSEAKALLQDRFLGAQTDCDSALAALDFGNGIQALKIAESIKKKLTQQDPANYYEIIKDRLEKISSGLRSLASFAKNISRFGTFDLSQSLGVSIENKNLSLLDFSNSLFTYLEKAKDSSDDLVSWSMYVSRRKEAEESGLKIFVELLEDKQVRPIELSDAYGYCVHSSIIREAFKNIPHLSRFSGLKHNQIRDEFKRLDREIISLRGKAIGFESAKNASLPYGQNGARVDDKTEMVLLKYLLPQQRPRMPVRKILKRAGASIQELKPCFMMGPQAVAQYLTPGAIKFDLVIMDEASQLKPEESIGAIARGMQLVVVGDPKQLPPTSFFSKMSQVGDDEEQFSTTDAESILDVCSSNFHPPRSLRWHYRSQHHSLIAFSNHNFYGGNLVIFPSPYGQSYKLGVRAVYLADAVYENQTNIREAKRVVDAVVEHIATRPDDSLGIVTLNIKQRDLISELMEERLRSISGADEFKEKWAVAGQSLFVKNLENVQGDERDAIIISTTFGKPPGSSAVRQNFGPISRQGGWRRLNVLFTRAKKSVAVYTSLRPEDIVDDSSTPEGTKALRNYLEFARSGTLTVATQTNLDPDSDFEVSVMDMLKTRGYEVTPQLGVAGYRIDIAVKHPDAPGSYLAAVECDGATYHSALSVRDRDRIRQEILESLGWRGRIWRIWSTDWFRTPRQESEKLISFLEGLRNSWKPEHVSGNSWIEESDTSTLISPIASNPFNKEVVTQAAFDLDDVSSVLIADDDDLEVSVGDVVRYSDLDKPLDILTVQITRGNDDRENGIVNESRPLAQILLGAVVGDEVTLHLPGSKARVFQIVEIRKG
jgi:superfamily I DNA and/or RNA helicase